MVKPCQLIGTLASVGLILGSGGAISVTSAAAEIMAPESNIQQHHNSISNQEFQRIEQPLSVKLLVTAIGASLIGLELWWFLGSKPKSQKANIRKPTPSGL